jgi:hypothetical protein
VFVAFGIFKVSVDHKKPQGRGGCNPQKGAYQVEELGCRVFHFATLFM